MPRRKNKEEHSEVIENVQSSKASKRRKGSAKKSTTSRRSNLTKNTKANLKGTANSSKKAKQVLIGLLSVHLPPVVRKTLVNRRNREEAEHETRL